MEFEWDEVKREKNLEKHWIDFRDACCIWAGPVIDPADMRDIGGERRYLALGMIGDENLIIAVIYTQRSSFRRLISARRARRNERATFQDRFGQGR